MAKEPKDDPILEKLHHQLFHLVEEIKELNKTLKEELGSISFELHLITTKLKNDRRF
jgi:hypothetical protein